MVSLRTTLYYLKEKMKNKTMKVKLKFMHRLHEVLIKFKLDPRTMRKIFILYCTLGLFHFSRALDPIHC